MRLRKGKSIYLSQQRVMKKERKIMLMKNNPISYKKRIKELFFDYVLILIYLAFLFGVNMAVYYLFLRQFLK